MVEKCPALELTYPTDDPLSAFSPNSAVGRTVSNLLVVRDLLEPDVFDPLFSRAKEGSYAAITGLAEELLDRAASDPPIGDEQALRERAEWYGGAVSVIKRPWLAHKTALSIGAFANYIVALEANDWQLVDEERNRPDVDSLTDSTPPVLANMLVSLRREIQDHPRSATAEFNKMVHVSYAGERFRLSGYMVEESLLAYKGLIDNLTEPIAREAMLDRYASLVTSLPAKLQWPKLINCEDAGRWHYREVLRSALDEGSSAVGRQLSNTEPNILPAGLQLLTAVVDGRRRQIPQDVLTAKLVDNIDVMGRSTYCTDQISPLPIGGSFYDRLHKAVATGSGLFWDDSGTRLEGRLTPLEDSSFRDRIMPMSELYGRTARGTSNPQQAAAKYAHRLTRSGVCLVRYAVQLEPDMQAPFRALAAHMEQEYGGKPNILNDDGVLFPARATFALVLDRLLHDGVASSSPEWSFLDKLPGAGESPSAGNA